MGIPNKKHWAKFSILLVTIFFSNNISAQSVNVDQEAQFEQLLNEKRKINASLSTNKSYKIQIFNGSADESKKTLIQFRKENKNFDATIVFSTPAYKVWIGNFKTRIEAERNLSLLKKKYPNAIIIKPSSI